MYTKFEIKKCDFLIINVTLCETLQQKKLSESYVQESKNINSSTDIDGTYCYEKYKRQCPFHIYSRIPSNP